MNNPDLLHALVVAGSAVGTFLTSAGFGGLMTGLGVWAAVAKARGDRRESLVNAERDRWWRVFTWIDDNLDELDAATFMDLHHELSSDSTVRGQHVILKGLTIKYGAHTATPGKRSPRRPAPVVFDVGGETDRGGAGEAERMTRDRLPRWGRSKVGAPATPEPEPAGPDEPTAPYRLRRTALTGRIIVSDQDAARLAELIRDADRPSSLPHGV